MGRINFIKQFKKFNELKLVNSLSANAQSLYFNLLDINNKCNWQKEFTVSNSTLMAHSGLNMSSLQRARNNLIQKGYITYKKGKKNEAGTYTIIELKEFDDDVQNYMQNEQLNEQLNEQANDNSTNTLNKQNKTKHIYSCPNENICTSKSQNNFQNLALEYENLAITTNTNAEEEKEQKENFITNNADDCLQCDCFSKTTHKKCQRKSTYNINGKNYCNQHSKEVFKELFSNGNTNAEERARKKDIEKVDKENFEMIWNEYPRKEGKANAYQNFLKYIHGGRIINCEKVKLTTDQILDAVWDYARECEREKKEKQYIMNGATFFNGRILDYVKQEKS